MSVILSYILKSTLEEETKLPQQVLLPKIEEDIDLIDDQEDSHAVAAYYVDGVIENESRYDNIQLDNKLGLAIETLHEGLTIDQLWRVL